MLVLSEVHVAVLVCLHEVPFCLHVVVVVVFLQLLMNRENETVTERLERLKMEVAELADDVKAIRVNRSTWESVRERDREGGREGSGVRSFR